VEAPSTRLVSCFELLRAQAAKVTVTAGAIVEGLDVLRHVSDREVPVLVDLLFGALFLHATKEGLDDGGARLQ